MPDVLSERHRATYDDAYEVIDADGADVVGVATLAVDQDFHGVSTGKLDPLPIRVYTIALEDDEQGPTAYLSLDGARELRDVLDAAILQVEWTRWQRLRAARSRGA